MLGCYLTRQSTDWLTRLTSHQCAITFYERRSIFLPRFEAVEADLFSFSNRFSSGSKPGRGYLERIVNSTDKELLTVDYYGKFF